MRHGDAAELGVRLEFAEPAPGAFVVEEGEQRRFGLVDGGFGSTSPLGAVACFSETPT